MGGADLIDAAIMKLLDLETTEDTLPTIEEYWAKVADNLKKGHVRLLFIADQLPAELRRIIEFLNEQMTEVEVLGIELAHYVGSDFRALVPRVIGQTEAIRQMKQGMTSSKRHINMHEFLASCPVDLRDFLADAISVADKHGMQIYWGTKGFSLRAKIVSES